MNESSPLLSFIPEQGPFHVFLNLKIYHFILERIYKETFGSVLPKKPKPFRISLVITAVFLAWTKLSHKVLQKFQLCKDIEYSCLLFLLDEVIPLSFFHYPVTFRSGNLDDYMLTMLKLSILFIIWQRSHYDRSTLSMLSDFCFHKQHFPQYQKQTPKSPKVLWTFTCRGWTENQIWRHLSSQMEWPFVSLDTAIKMYVLDSHPHVAIRTADH